MATALKGKKGVWAKAGAGGSYRGYKYERAAPGPYHDKDGKPLGTLPQQKAIGEKGRKMGTECKGKKGPDFRKCRHEALK